MLTLTHGDGTRITTSYSGRASHRTDENGASRISQIDGLGRTTVVCEISSNNSMPGSGQPTSCGTDITGTGFTTTYSYALATGTTTVTQGAQTRTFQNDWLGRPVSVTEPESGTTTYGYTFNATGLQVTRTRPKANQTSPSAQTTTTTQYDSIGRVVSIAYGDGTPTKTFVYDTSAGPGFSDLAQANLKGRLSVASVPTAGTAYSYDAVGRPIYLDECLPSGCGTASYNHQLHYTYDWAGNLTSSADWGGVVTTYSLSPANELWSMTSSLNAQVDPPNLISNVQNGPNGPVSYNMGNGLSNLNAYDSLGRLEGGWVCNAANLSIGCTGGTQYYGYWINWSGVQATLTVDSILNQTSNNSYDEFNRLSSRTLSGTQATSSYVYDRYGNRWQQNSSPSGPSPQYSFNASNNQISTYSYDAAGNMTNDGFHTYTYDAEGNITAVDGGATAQYVDNAFNQRVRTVVGSAATEFVFNVAGKRVSSWNGTTRGWEQGQYYWGGSGRPVAFYENGVTHFQHQDWLGTERIRTTYNGAVEGTFTSLPFGDAQATASGSDLDAYHFGSLDSDAETGTDHAQFRQYSSTQGRWLSPDPYSGSYDFTNPQSFNRYAYVMNNPLAYTDPFGLYSYTCITTPDEGEGYAGDDGSVGVVGGSTYCEIWGDGGGGGTGGGQAGGGGGGGAPSSPPKSPARQQCEKTAAAVKQGAIGNPAHQFNVGLLIGMGIGAVGGAWKGAAVGCAVTVEIGCFEGALAGIVPGAIVGGTTAIVPTLAGIGINIVEANNQYQQDMEACSKL